MNRLGVTVGAGDTIGIACNWRADGERVACGLDGVVELQATPSGPRGNGHWKGNSDTSGGAAGDVAAEGGAVVVGNKAAPA